MPDGPLRRPSSAEFRAEGGNTKLTQRAYEEARDRALKDFTEKRAMYHWDETVTDLHIKILANLAGEYARQAVANVTFELRAQFINERATQAEHDAPTREVARTATKEFNKP